MNDTPITETAVPAPPDNPALLPIQSMIGPGELFSKAFDFFKRRWQVLVLISLVPLAMLIVLVVIGLIFGLAGAFSFAAFAQGNASLETGGLLLLVVGIVVFYILLIIISLWAQVATLVVISRPGELIGVGEAYSMAKGRLWSYFATTFIVGLLTFPGYMLLAVPGVILSIWFAFASIIAVKENIVGLNAALTSRGLVRGRTVAVFGRYFVLVLVYIAVYVFFIMLQAMLKSSSDTFSAALAVNLALQVVFYILNMISLIYTYLMYENLKQLHQGPVVIADSTRKKYILFGVGGFAVAALLFFGVIVSMIAAGSMMRDTLQNQSDLKQNLNESQDRYMYEDPSTVPSDDYYQEDLLLDESDTEDTTPVDENSENI